MGLSEEEMERIGHSKDSARLPPESGGGYMASLEVNHQIHCLVSLAVPITLRRRMLILCHCRISCGKVLMKITIFIMVE